MTADKIPPLLGPYRFSKYRMKTTGWCAPCNTNESKTEIMYTPSLIPEVKLMTIVIICKTINIQYDGLNPKKSNIDIHSRQPTMLHRGPQDPTNVRNSSLNSILYPKCL